MTMIEKDEYKIWIEQGILIAQFAKGLIVTEEIMKSAIDDRLALFKEQEYPLMIDATLMKYATRKALEYTNKPYTQKGIRAFALLTDNTIIQISGNFYMKYIQRPPHPSRIFTDRRQAMEFLRQFRVA